MPIAHASHAHQATHVLEGHAQAGHAQAAQVEDVLVFFGLAQASHAQEAMTRLATPRQANKLIILEWDSICYKNLDLKN